MRKSFRIISGTFGAWMPMSMLCAWTRQRFLFPYYHAVSDNPSGHLRHVYPCRSASRFRKDLEFLLRHYQPADLEILKAWQEKPRSLKKPSFLLSFDDGLQEVYEIIAPVLRGKGIPAIFFLNTDFIDNQDLFYRYKISLIMERLVSCSPAVTEILQSRFNLPGSSKKNIRKFIMGIPYQNRGILEEIAQLIGLDFKAYLRVKKPYMSREQVRELAGQGFYIGAHSRDHPGFSSLDQHEQLLQFRESLDLVQGEFNQEYGLFAFPFGDEGNMMESARQLRESGRVLATFGTAGLKKDPLSFHHQRIPMEALRMPAGITLKGEYVYYLAKSLFGRNTLRR